MAAPRVGSYSPKSGVLAGRIFLGAPGTTQAYNRYQDARAQVLGFANYRDQRQAAKSSVFRGLVTSEAQKTGGKVSLQKREQFLRGIAQNQRIETVVEGKRVSYRKVLDVDVTDHRIGGSLDRYLQAIGRRTANDWWAPGETPH